MAKGAGESLERHCQAEQQWDMNLPSLHLSIPHYSEQQKAKWLKSIKSIRHGGPYYVRSLEAAPLEESGRVLLPWIDTDPHWKSEWMSSAEVRRTVANCARDEWFKATTWNWDDMLIPPDPTCPTRLNGQTLR